MCIRAAAHTLTSLHIDLKSHSSYSTLHELPPMHVLCECSKGQKCRQGRLPGVSASADTGAPGKLKAPPDPRKDCLGRRPKPRRTPETSTPKLSIKIQRKSAKHQLGKTTAAQRLDRGDQDGGDTSGEAPRELRRKRVPGAPTRGEPNNMDVRPIRPKTHIKTTCEPTRQTEGRHTIPPCDA